MCLLLAALEKDDPTVKIRIFELLSAICVYSPEGYVRVIDVLEHYKVRHCRQVCLPAAAAGDVVVVVKISYCDYTLQ